MSRIFRAGVLQENRARKRFALVLGFQFAITLLNNASGLGNTMDEYIYKVCSISGE